jgi:hypothetical protein
MVMSSLRWPQVPGPVRAVPVVMVGVLLQDRPQMPRFGDQYPVGDLGPSGAWFRRLHLG